MVTVLFKCPKCQVCCISSLTLMDDVFALANDIPVRRRCWSCGAESLVVQKPGTRAAPQNGSRDLSYGRCVQGAAACRLRATDAKHPALRKLFLRMEESWLRLGVECGGEQRPPIIGGQTGAPVDSPETATDSLVRTVGRRRADPLAPDQLEGVVPGAAPPSPVPGSPVALPIRKGRKASGVRMSLGTSKSRAAPRICSAGFGKPDRRP